MKKPPSMHSFLERYAQDQIPAPPVDLKRKIWSEIERRKSASDEGSIWLDLNWIQQWIARPSSVFGTLATTILLGFGITWISPDRKVSETEQTSFALNLQIFSESSPNLPSSLLSSQNL